MKEHNREEDQLDTANRVLGDFVATDRDYRAIHVKCDGQLLTRFFSATMDEARLRFADAYAEQALGVYDVSELSHFRQGVHRREVGRTMAYDGQRDHSAHTVNNYILGAYFWVHCKALQEALKADMVRREILPNPTYFYGLWQFASLLHDVGYLFEGAAHSGEAVGQSSLSRVGVEVVREFFESRFWIECQINSPAHRRGLREAAEVQALTFHGDGFSAILEGLRDIGPLEGLLDAINRPLRSAEKHNLCVPELHDAFDIWRAHYKAFGVPKMSSRIKDLEGYVHSCIYRGLDGSGLRMLDHGACSGLLTLRASTYYYALLFGLLEKDGSPKFVRPELQEAQTTFLNALRSRDPEYSPDWWWRAICWTTAASAIHNHLQMTDLVVRSEALSLEEDSLAYLGILVDIIQEWDRFRVVPNALGKEAPLQGVDVNLSHEADKIVVQYPARMAKKVRTALDGALSGWTRLVSVVDL